ncbi:conserved hypothetical protein [uncultured Desulfobacterium sp.]|uniref:Uncharacterized protein n=1 Tax=uncultured Desulfobacterium sp. TaxID=201089 RepID=A0A445MYK7_9BACT|nr:conserved hypothetical protein [uncultured Desulfobacterium sp.]
MEEEVIGLIEKRGPLTGAEILEATGVDSLILWRTCMLSQSLIVRHIGTRYLRLDRAVDGFARMSPSILREFLTYSIVGFNDDIDPLEQKARELISHIEKVSKAKMELAYRIVSGLIGGLGSEWALKDEICFIIAGDIVFNMAHDVPRPERSTGRLVTGSDMDIVVVVSNEFPDDLMKRLDDEIYREKYSLLMAPHVKEEIDYIVKRLSRIREQVRFDSFKHMVACKILDEGTLLYGSEDLFTSIKSMLRESGVTDKLNILEKKARTSRNESEQYLLFQDPVKIKDEGLSLFYPTEESEEFE